MVPAQAQVEATQPSPNSVVDVVITNQYPNIQSFGLDIVGGVDRPCHKENNGIFVSAVKEGGLAQKCGLLEVGDQILEINGYPLGESQHDDVVKLFVSNRSRVSLKVKKNRLQILKAASATPSTPATPIPRPNHTPSDSLNEGEMSIAGFVFGLALGCVSVVLLRRYLTSSSSGKS